MNKTPVDVAMELDAARTRWGIFENAVKDALRTAKGASERVLDYENHIHRNTIVFRWSDGIEVSLNWDFVYVGAYRDIPTGRLRYRVRDMHGTKSRFRIEPKKGFKVSTVVQQIQEMAEQARAVKFKKQNNRQHINASRECFNRALTLLHIRNEYELASYHVINNIRIEAGTPQKVIVHCLIEPEKLADLLVLVKRAEGDEQ